MKKEYILPAVTVSRFVPMQIIAISVMTGSETVVDNEEDVWVREEQLPEWNLSNGQEEW